MTYPHPSRGYQELVCTAGVTEQGEWVRLYPVDYRYRPRNQQFRKYQWIEVDLFPHGAGNDRRKESRKPVLDTLRVLGEPLSTKNGWNARRQIIDQIPIYTVKQLWELHESEHVSLGIVQPTRVIDLKIEPADSEWKSEWQTLFDQLTLFGPVQKPALLNEGMNLSDDKRGSMRHSHQFIHVISTAKIFNAASVSSR